MAHEVETMAYNAIETPWHGLGNPVTANMSTNEMLQAAGLDWENDSEPLYIYDQTSGEYKALDSLNADNTHYRAIIRATDGYVHNIMTDDYRIVQNHKVMEFFREYVEAAGMNLETAGALKHGSLIWVLAKINKSFILPGNDKSETYVLLSNSHDGSQEFQGQFTSVRVVCANTIRMAQAGKRGRSFSMKHSATLTDEVIKDAKRQLGVALEATEKYAEMAEMMTRISVSAQETYAYVAELVPASVKVTDTAPKLITDGTDNPLQRLDSGDFSKVGREILLSIAMGSGSDLPSAKDTVWGLLNGVTHYVDHNAGRNRDSALTSAWFGMGADLKQRAYASAVKLVQR